MAKDGNTALYISTLHTERRNGRDGHMRKGFVCPLFAIAAVTIVIFTVTGIAANEQHKGSITVVYHHEGGAAADDLVKRGGFGAYIQLEDRALIFDAGGEATVILENLHTLGLTDIELEALIISHNHWDHVYGIPGVMGAAKNSPPVYVAESAAVGIKQQFPRATVIGVDGPKEITTGIWLTGPMEIEFMGARLSEQALVLDVEDGLYVIVGCSHPGIAEIVERVTDLFPEKRIALVAGGFHLRSTGEAEIRQIAADLERLGVQKIGPSHCTGETAVRIFREKWGKDFVSFNLGDSYRF